MRCYAGNNWTNGAMAKCPEKPSVMQTRAWSLQPSFTAGKPRSDVPCVAKTTFGSYSGYSEKIWAAAPVLLVVKSSYRQ